MASSRETDRKLTLFSRISDSLQDFKKALQFVHTLRRSQIPNPGRLCRTEFEKHLMERPFNTWMTILLVGTGLYLSIRFGFRYNFRNIGFHFRNTFGKMFQKGEGTGTVSGFAAACTAMANTIGVGNIGGVATAIVAGGPGAVFWMWVSGLLGMSTKACEIIIGQRYRVKYSESVDEYMCDRSFVMKNALGWKAGAMVLAVACFVLGPWTCCVQTESVTSSLQEGFGVAPIVSVIVLGITCFLTIWGGLKRIASVMEKVIPVMAMVYIIGGLGILLTHITMVPAAFALIIKSAFTPMAGIGGFAGATVRDAVRYGVARGLYSRHSPFPDPDQCIRRLSRRGLCPAHDSGFQGVLRDLRRLVHGCSHLRFCLDHDHRHVLQL